jgi:two-component system cell cycle response regulator
VGVISLSKLGRDQFTADDRQTMSIFAGHAAQAVANAAAYAQLERQSAELSRRLDLQRQLLAITEQLLSTLSPTDVLERIADGLFSVVRYDNLSIFRADHERRALLPVLARERYAEEVLRHVAPFGQGLMGWAVDHAEPLLVNDALSDPRALQIPGTPVEPEAIIVVPLIAGGQVIGALNVGRVGGLEVAFSDGDFELVQLFAAQAAIALRAADEHDAVRLRAETDALTGVGNHGAFQRDVQRALAEARREGADPRVALLMMDLDRFKAYNDRHGHPAGDALLKAVARTIESAARRADRVYRYGGDEFALILRGSDVSGARRVARRVRRAVAALTAGSVTPVTMTVGIGASPADAEDRDGLVTAADIALYYGKQAGEDRVITAASVPPETRTVRGSLDRIARATLGSEREEHHDATDRERHEAGAARARREGRAKGAA